MMATTQSRAQSASESALDGALQQVIHRLRRQRQLRDAVRGLLFALAIDVLLALGARVELLPDGAPLFACLSVLALLGAGAGAMAASRYGVVRMDAARLAEARLPLKERLSSALEFENPLYRTPLLALQREDAGFYARHLDPRAAVPLGAPREAWLLLPALVLLALALWLPALPFGETPAQRAEHAAVQGAGTRLTQTARTIEKRAEAQGLEKTKRAAQKVQVLGRRMARGQMDKAQAMAALAQQEKELDFNSPAQSVSGSDDPGKAARQLAAAGRDLASSPGKGNPSTPSGKSAPDADVSQAAQAMQQNDPEALRQSLQNLSRRVASGQDSPATSARRIADALKGTPYTDTQRHMESAAEALQKGDTARAAEEMRQAAEAARREGASQQDAQGMQDARQAMEDARRQMAQAGEPGNTPAQTPAASQTPGTAQNGRGGGNSGLHGAPHTGNQTDPGRGNENPGGAPGAGGGSGEHPAKFPFHQSLPPTSKSTGPALSLGAPPKGNPGAIPLGRSPGLPTGKPNASRIPYGKSLPGYRRSAESAMDRENVPPSQRTTVRDYFNSLQTGK